ncbi:hypothetical protein MIR68_001796 [Amoeboaphelidium protococcarum]|nr:hypothetical protein MIR68_001796 [Amoeboaphelidium protococcarum]
MKLLTHNLLACPSAACRALKSDAPNFPLILKEVVLAEKSTEQSEAMTDDDENQLLEDQIQFVRGFVESGKCDYSALYHTALSVGIQLPEQIDALTVGQDQKVLEDITRALLTEVVEGQLQCQRCETEYQIKKGIPNMLTSK